MTKRWELDIRKKYPSVLPVFPMTLILPSYGVAMGKLIFSKVCYEHFFSLIN